MQRYGQAITWGPLSAPRLFTGQTRDYSIRDSVTKQLITDISGDNMAMVLHSQKADINFEALVTEASVDFLDLSSGGAIVVSNIPTGLVLVRRAVETWRLGQPKTAGVQGTYYPDMVQTNPTLAGTTLNAMTPDQSELNIVYPGGKLIYSTAGLTHLAGIVHGLTLEQILQITEDEPSPDGKLLGASVHGYERNIQLDLLATGDAPAVTATLPRDNVMRFEFGGDFAGLPEPLLEVVVADAPEGDLTWALTLDRPALATLLESAAAVTLPLEVELGIGDDSVDGGVRVEKFRTDLTIQRGLIFGLLATAADIDWLRPLPTNYVPFTADQIFQGQLYYACTLGDGEALGFVIDHNLASDAIASVLLRENIADGRVLVQGVDYVVTYGGANSLTVTLAPGTTAPATAGLMVVITAAGMRDAWRAHTHTIQQIELLEERLEEIGQRLDVLEDYLPSAAPSVSSGSGTTLTIDIPNSKEVLFYTEKLPDDLSTLPARAPALLPAVHDPALDALPDPLPEPVADTVWSVATRTQVFGGNKIRTSWAPAGGFVGSDGRMLYPVTKAGTTVSYYPTPFERTLWEFAVNDKMLRVNRTLVLNCSVAVQLLNASTEAQWVLVIEQGKPVDQTDPANEGQNLADVIWNATPILSQRLLVTPLSTLHTFGCRIKRTADTTLAADRLLYGDWEAATGAAPETANFLLRARLVQFDTKNNVANATGWLIYAFGGDTSSAPAKATIS